MTLVLVGYHQPHPPITASQGLFSLLHALLQPSLCSPCIGQIPLLLPPLLPISRPQVQFSLIVPPPLLNTRPGSTACTGRLCEQRQV